MKHPLRALSLFLMLSLFLVACGSSPTTASTATATSVPVKLKVFAAASLTESFNEIKTHYQSAHPGVTLEYQFAGSQALVAQLTNGAAADVFASADQANMQKASDAGLVDKSQIFARNRLVVIVPKSNTAHIASLQDLAKSGVKLVVGAPAVPIGKYALQVLDKLGGAASYGVSFENSVKGNIVSQEQDVKSVVNKVQIGEADAGIVYRTDVTPTVEQKVTVIDIPDPYNVVAQYPIAVLKNAANATDAQTFVQYILSDAGQAILTKHRFIAATSNAAAA